ncbi:hypothetical protein CAEBREN_30041 [Caenorhabditis brenneri]|uniref:Chromo domain-containing protein n=1 Tax=Caenorhabditis brenneri TaxID=135651 RepID=G0NRT8_CAEBE|nr:hypothetical protein CAEBREN_30041 [Caenorhabditis brenneri]
MSGKSTQNTPSRSSSRAQKKTTIFQVGTATKTPKKNTLNIKKIVGHHVFDTHYVDYEVVLGNGETKKNVTEFQFDKNSKILIDYKQKVTKQSDDPNGEYEVEAILAHREVNGKPLFLVRWRGYSSPLWNSEMWEQDLSNCKNLLRAYKNENALSTSTPAKTPSKLGKQAPKPTPKSSQTSKKRAVTLEDEDFEPEEESLPPTKKTKIQSERMEPASSSKDLIEREEEIQESDDDDEEEEKPSTSTSTPAPAAATKSRWGFGSWGWF